MPPDAKPLILKDELARLARDADPGSWLRDAHDAIEAWRGGMPNAQRAKLVSVLEPESLELKADDGWNQVRGFALYRVDRSGLRFHASEDFHKSRPERLARTTLGDEQAFIAHLMQVLRLQLERFR